MTRIRLVLALLAVLLLGPLAPPAAAAAAPTAAAPTAAPAAGTASDSGTVSVSSPGSRAESVGDVADALRENPVYVEPRASGRLSDAAADDLTAQIEGSDKPVFVAVLPRAPEFPPDDLLQDLRAQVDEPGVYAVVLGDDFAAGADRNVLARGDVDELRRSAEAPGGDTKAKLDRFVDGATAQARGSAPSSWNGGAPGGALIALLAVLALCVGGGLLVRNRARKRRRAEEQEQLARLRQVVDEDITAFGEELDRIGFDPQAGYADDAMRADYTEAIDAYDEAKRKMDAAERPGDVRGVTESLEDGRFALATLEARRSGDPLPERRMPCFFDPRHGPSVEDVRWAPPGGEERPVPVCAADATRLRDGAEPMARTVETAEGRRPYWDAGPVYGPWAGGYFGGGVLPALLVGTMLGNAMGPWGYGDGYGGFDGAGGEGDGGFDGGGFDGGGDFGGGGFDGGGF